MDFPLSRREFKKLPVNDRIEVIIADGVWYSFMKWKKLAKCTDEELTEFINTANPDFLVQSKTGAHSYRYTKEGVREWHRINNLSPGDQIVDFIFPARFWDGQTETEGFLDAPLREIGTVTFACSNEVSENVKESLRGIAKIREEQPGVYKAYCLHADYVKEIIKDVFEGERETDVEKIYSRAYSLRRELVDFSPKFSHHILSFYKNFAKSLVKPSIETIKIYIPDPHEQETQVIIWVINAIEKFDEKSSVPFVGYLNSVLRRWPYNLPYIYLGRDLSAFQRRRAIALKALKELHGSDRSFTNNEMAKELGMNVADFVDLESRHQNWLKERNASSITWESNSEEKKTVDETGVSNVSSESDIIQANKLSVILINIAIDNDMYLDSLKIISQMGAGEINDKMIKGVSAAFITKLAESLDM